MNASRDSYLSDNLELLLNAFKEIELEAILSDASDLGYTSLSQALFTAAKKAEGEGNRDHYTILKLLDEVCTLKLLPNRPNNPFDDDFSDSEIAFFAGITRQVNNPFLRGRLADRVWNSPEHRNIKFALIAIDSYTSISLDADTWFEDGDRCWNRAISLCLLIGKGAEDRLSQIERAILEALEGATTQRGFYGDFLANTLMKNGLAKSQSSTVATKLESLASGFDDAANYYTSGKYYHASANWYRNSGFDEKVMDMTIAEAEAFEKEATAKVSSDDPSHAVAAGFLKNAVQILLSIPREHRHSRQVDQRIQELKLRIDEYGSLALEEMETYTTPGIDLSESIAQAREYVSGKPVFEALLMFANLYPVNVNDMRKSAIESLSLYPLHRLFPKVILSHDGRVVNRTPGFSGAAVGDEYESDIRAEMNRYYYGTGILVAVQALILPALDVLNSEHCLNEVDFIDLARRSPIVPRGREVLWGRALFQGFNHDFVNSIHLLVPQIEHMVRFHLKSRGVITTFTDYNSGGIETENGLSTLMKQAEVESIFGEDLTYEIQTLFCDPIGPNIRNYIAHGLLDDQQCHSIDSIYAWWLGLKLIVMSFWLSLTANSTEEQDD